MKDKERLYDAFGELLYAIAMADGVIQEEEMSQLQEILNDHPWASNISWSFNYEVNKGLSVDEVYQKVVSFCQSYGPAHEYAEMLDVMTKIADASAGVDFDESIIIESFEQDLINYFKDHTKGF
ncbi:MAG: TerB family tellurite resistance protein [Flavobacteriales bacterium]|nr:TerB family tellurite resistance protein [Flavobacteriales bacterium]